jgi:ribonuclease BN (tRNA processing enzyme)
MCENGAELVYTSDTGFSREVADFARGVAVLLMECSFRVKPRHSKHLDLADAMRLAELARPGRVVLSHLYPVWDGADIAAEARQLWPGEILAAFDGLRLEVEGIRDEGK